MSATTPTRKSEFVEPSMHSTGTLRRTATAYIPTLDGWRALAIVGVLVCHGTDAIFAPDGSSPHERLHAYTRLGSLGVDVFFGISGFLICTRLLDEQRSTGSISLTHFYGRRIFRILPPCIAYLAVVGVLGAAGALVVGVWQWIGSLLFFRNYVASAQLGGWYTGHFWSLSVEEHFYLLWPGLLVLCGVRKARWAAAGLALLVAAWRVVEFRFQFLSAVLPGANFYARTDIRLDGLLWGCWFALLMHEPRWRAFFQRWFSVSVWILLLLAFLITVWRPLPLNGLWQALLIPLLLIGTIVRPRSLIGRLLEARPVRWVGRISYSLYVWQQLFLVGIREPRPCAFGYWQEWPRNFVLVFLCAVGSYYLIERPCTRLGRSLTTPTNSKQEK